MLHVLSHPFCLAIPVILTPGVLSWWWSRSLRSDAAVLPERWWAYVKRLSYVTTLCTMAVFALTGWGALWVLPCQFALLSFSTHRARSAMLGESWSWASYVVWRLRATVGFLGFWILIAGAPPLVASADATVRWWLAGGLAALALLWHRLFMRVLLFAIAATPLDRSDLDASFRPIFDRMDIPRPGLWRAGPRGGVIANAFALPSLSGGAVLFFDTLLERLAPEEIAAIFAHEVAHLEHYRDRVFRLYLGAWLAIPAVIAGSAALAEFAPDFVFIAQTVWPLGVVIGLGARAARMQQHETRSDVRAVELCGNAEALIGGLIRLHAINHVPRRFSARAEAQATHPSLARRIRDIRAHAGSIVSRGLEQPLLLVSPETGRFVVLDKEAVSFGEGGSEDAHATIDAIRQRASEVKSIRYDELIELRLATSHSAVTLIAVNRKSHRRTMAIRESDAAKAQAALDVVDQLLTAVDPPIRKPGWTHRLTALLGIMVSIPSSGTFAIVLPAILLLARPGRRVLAALAGGVCGAALMGLGDAVPNPSSALVLLTLAVAAAWQARTAPTEPEPEQRLWLWIERTAICVLPLATIAAIAIDARHLFDLHTLLRDETWIVAGWMSLMGYLAASASRPLRRGAAAAAVVTASAAWVASPWFLMTTGADSLITAMRPLQQRLQPLTPISQADVDGEFASVQLSADGTQFVVADSMDEYYEDDDETKPRNLVVGRFDGWSRRLRAVKATFADSERLLILDREHGITSLRAEFIRTADVIWMMTLPGVDGATLDAGSDGRWRVTGTSETGFHRITGRIGVSETIEAHWPLGHHQDDVAFKHLADDRDVSVAMTARWEPSAIPWWSPQRWRSETTLLAVGAARTFPVATTRQTIDCLPPPVDTPGFVCITFDGRDARVWRIDPQGGLVPVGWAPGFTWPGTYLGDDRVGVSVRDGPAVIQLNTGTIDVLSTSPDDCALDGHALVGDRVATACPTGGKTSVRLYRLN